MQQRSLSILSQQTAVYSLTASWANVPQFIITVPEDGDYNIGSVCTDEPSDTSSRGGKLALAINGNRVSQSVEFYQSAANLGLEIPTTLKMDNIPLKANDVVSLQAIYISGAAAVISYAAGTLAGSLQITKVGV